MINLRFLSKTSMALLLIFVSMIAHAALFGLGGDSWKEEVQLHDGQKIIVERSQTYGGNHEIGQREPEKEVTIRFTPPGSNTSISWTSEYGADLGRTNFNLLALHIKEGTPYLVTEPNLCLSYNKWGRPNPPYVFFRHDGNGWQRIAIAEVPIEFKTINLIVNNSRLYEIEKSSKSTGYVPFEAVKEINGNLRQPQLKTILREPLTKEKIDAMCEGMIHYKCGWFGTNPEGTFNKEFADRMCNK